MRGEIIDGVHRRDTMKASVQDTYGSPDVLELREIDKPVVGDDEVLVRVHAAGVDQGVWHLMAGVPYLMRIAGFGLRAPKNPVRGYDVAGRVEAVGENVTRFRPGDAVFGTCRGSFAEYASARADRLAPKPANLSFEQAAAVPISGYAALQAVRDPDGRLVIVGGEGGGRWLGGLDRQLRAHVLSPFVRQKLGTWISTERKEDLEELHDLLEAGAVTPVVDTTFPLSEAPEAIRYM